MVDSIKDILQLIANKSSYDSVVNYDCSKLWFSFRYGGIMLEVDCLEFKIGENYIYLESTYWRYNTNDI